MPKGLEGDYSELPGYFEMLGHGLLQAVERIRIQSEQQLLSEIAGLAVDQQSPRQFFDDVAGKVAGAFGACGCSIFVYDQFRDALVLGGTTGLYHIPDQADPNEEMTQYRLSSTELADLSYDRGEGLTGRIFEEQTLIRLYDALSSHECEGKVGGIPSYKSAEWPHLSPRTFLGAPIFFKGAFVGVIRLHGKPDVCGSSFGRYFLPSDENKLIAVSNVLGRSMHQWVAALSAREWANNNDSLLENMEQLLDGELDLRSSLVTIAEQAKTLLSGCAASILLVSPDEKFLTVEAEDCDRTPETARLKFSIDRGVCGAVVREKTVIAEPDTEAPSSRFEKMEDQIPGGLTDVMSEAAAPIYLGGKVVGVLNVDSECKHWFQYGDPKLRILERLASQAALVICREQDAVVATRNLAARALAHQFKDDLGAILLALHGISADGVARLGRHDKRSFAELLKLSKELAAFWDAIADIPAFDEHRLQSMYLNDVISSANYVLDGLSRKNVRLETNYGPELSESHAAPQMVQVDVLHIHLILSNLISNAVEAIEEEKTPDGLIRIETFVDQQNAVLSVKDNGCGISEDIDGDVFKKYVSSKHRKGKGCVLVRRMVEAHGGKVTHSRVETGGTKITVAIPLFRDDNLS